MQNYLLLPFVEIEVRLGTLGKTFDSSVDKKYFNEIKTNLQNTQNIFSIETKQTTEYINKNIKLISKDDKKESLQMKENVLNKTFSLNNSPFDIRLSINQEFSLNSYINSFSKNENIYRKSVLHL
jgi:hypothetical protein